LKSFRTTTLLVGRSPVVSQWRFTACVVDMLRQPRMGKKLDPIENAGFQQTCLDGAGER
jgi:hypothetical protein